jgi:hypothetical protein
MSKAGYIAAQRLKPLGVIGMEKIRRIASEGYDKVNEVLVDSYSASAIVAIYDHLSPGNQAKLTSMPVARVADICFKLINRSAASC